MFRLSARVMLILLVLTAGRPAAAQDEPLPIIEILDAYLSDVDGQQFAEIYLRVLDPENGDPIPHPTIDTPRLIIEGEAYGFAEFTTDPPSNVVIVLDTNAPMHGYEDVLEESLIDLITRMPEETAYYLVTMDETQFTGPDSLDRTTLITQISDYMADQEADGACVYDALITTAFFADLAFPQGDRAVLMVTGSSNHTDPLQCGIYDPNEVVSSFNSQTGTVPLYGVFLNSAVDAQPAAFNILLDSTAGYVAWADESDFYQAFERVTTAVTERWHARFEIAASPEDVITGARFEVDLSGQDTAWDVPPMMFRTGLPIESTPSGAPTSTLIPMTGQIENVEYDPETGELAFEVAVQGDVVDYAVRFFNLETGEQISADDLPGDPLLPRQSFTFDTTQFPDVSSYLISAMLVNVEGELVRVEYDFTLPQDAAAAPTPQPGSAEERPPIGDPVMVALTIGLFALFVVVIVMLFIVRRLRRPRAMPPAPLPHDPAPMKRQTTETSPAPITAFVSYRRSASAILATFLSRELAQQGIDAFVDTRKTDGAGPFPERLLREIEARDVIIVLLGAGTLDSAWVLREIEHADTLGKPMIPVFQEGYVAAPPANEHVARLLQYSGVHILDQKNIYIDEALRDIASIVRAVRKPSS